jgi:phosphatidylserine/phosphatidylglycerophosphate/cardiolipin synthase-like enzyme
MVEPILNEEHLGGVLAEALRRCRHRLWIATADVKHVHLPADALESRARGGRARGLLDVFESLSERGVEILLLHGSVPSGPFLERLVEHVPAGLTMRRCPRMHAKAVLVDGRWMYLGSANLTGAGLGAKSPRRRNFEAGIWTDEPALIDPVGDLFQEVFSGGRCADCGRREQCPVPLEEP